MPIHLHTCDNGLGYHIHYSGTVTDDEYREHIERYPAISDEDFNKIRYGLTDLTDVEEFLLDTDTVVEMGRRSAETIKRNPSLLIAIAAPNDVGFGLSNVWSVWLESSPANVRLFRSVEPARQWLRDQLRLRQGLKVQISPV